MAGKQPNRPGGSGETKNPAKLRRIVDSIVAKD